MHLFKPCVRFRFFNIKVSTAICDVQNASRPSHLPPLTAANVQYPVFLDDSWKINWSRWEGGGRHLRLDTKSNFLRGTDGKSMCYSAGLWTEI